VGPPAAPPAPPAAPPPPPPPPPNLLPSTPAAGEELDSAPESVVLVFSEELNPDLVTITVTESTGFSLADGPPQISGAEVVQPLIPASGEYTVAYRVVSADGHPIQGTVTFTVTAPAPEPSATEQPDTSPTTEPTEEDTVESEETLSAGTVAQESSDEGDGLGAWWWVIGAGAAIVVGILAYVLVASRAAKSRG